MTINNIPENCISLKEHFYLLVQANDRRYGEVNSEREKALKIKEEADKIALSLAAEIQNYKNEKANELREQLSSERNLYATKQDIAVANEKVFLVVQPLVNYVNSQQGKSNGLNQGWVLIIGGVGLISTLLNIYLIFNK